MLTLLIEEAYLIEEAKKRKNNKKRMFYKKQNLGEAKKKRIEQVRNRQPQKQPLSPYIKYGLPAAGLGAAGLGYAAYNPDVLDNLSEMV